MSSRSHPAAWLLPLLLAVTASNASAAQGLSLAWNHCFGEATAVQNKSFACNTNNGIHVMAGTFMLASPMPHVIGAEVVMELASASATLPQWWEMKNASGCRPTALTMNTLKDPTDTVCEDWAADQAVGGIGRYCTVTFPCLSGGPSAANTAILRLISAVPQAGEQDLAADVEYFDFNLVIANAKTVGAGNCAGCDVPVCIVLNSINVVDAGNVSPRFIANAAVPGSNTITWQGGGVPVTPRGTGCPAATPTRKSTWGSVKSLYR